MEDVRTIPPAVRAKKKRFVTAALNATPEGAIRYLRERGAKINDAFVAKIIAEAEDAALVASALNTFAEVNVVRRSIERAAKKGFSFQQWKEKIAPKLAEQMGARRKGRLEMIYRTNMNSAYNAAQWAEVRARVKDGERVILRYDAIRDSRTRDSHAALDGVALPAGHPFWKSNYPPNGYNCRCSVTALSAATARELGVKITDAGKLPALRKAGKPHPDFAFAPDAEIQIGGMTAKLVAQTKTRKQWSPYSPRLQKYLPPFIAELLRTRRASPLPVLPGGYLPEDALAIAEKISGKPEVNSRLWLTYLGAKRMRENLIKNGHSPKESLAITAAAADLSGAAWRSVGKELVAEKNLMEYRIGYSFVRRDWILRGGRSWMIKNETAAEYITRRNLLPHRDIRGRHPELFLTTLSASVSAKLGGKSIPLTVSSDGVKWLARKIGIVKVDGDVVKFKPGWTEEKTLAVTVWQLDKIKEKFSQKITDARKIGKTFYVQHENWKLRFKITPGGVSFTGEAPKKKKGKRRAGARVPALKSAV